MEVLIKITGISIIVSILGVTLKRNSPEMTLILGISLAVLAVSLLAKQIAEITDTLSELAESAGINSIITVTLAKLVGISALSRIAADCCSDGGSKTGESVCDFAGSVAAIIISIPLISGIFGIIGDIL